MTVRTLQDEQASIASMRRRPSRVRPSFGCRCVAPQVVAPFCVRHSNTITARAACARVQRPAVLLEFPLSISVVIDIEYATLEVLQRNRLCEARFGVDQSPDREWT